jgi:hypothetical protein
MGKILELAGQRFGKLIVENQNPVRALSGSVRWDCICDCGKKTTTIGTNLIKGFTHSCGCIQKEAVTTHGMTGTPEYNSWNSMIQRCTNSNHDAYYRYGGRGITVCDRWLNSVYSFIEDMGFRPSSNHTLDRIENDKGYYKDNCRWATRTEQNNNTSSNVFYEYKGSKYTIPQLAELPEAKENDIELETLASRIRYSKWSVEKSLNQPVRRKSETT